MGNVGPVNLFDANFMGSPGIQQNVNPAGGEIGEPWLGGGFYDPQAGTSNHPQDRDISSNPVDPPKFVMRPSRYPDPLRRLSSRQIRRTTFWLFSSSAGHSKQR